MYANSGAPLSINDTEKPVQLSRRKQRRQQITAALDRLANTFPQTFFVYGAHRKPLKIGIANDIAATGAIPPEELRWVLRSYCGATGYFRSCKEGATRVDLAGNEAGIVTADEAEYAREKLAAVLARRQPQPTPQPQATADAQRVLANRSEAKEKAAREQKPATADPARQPRGDGFAALKAAAARRREAAG